MLLRIKSSYFVAGIIIENGTVIQAAPIVGYMIRWRHQRVMDYCRKKRWILDVLEIFARSN